MKLIPEWEVHDKCLMAWPCNKNLYNEIIKDARLEMAHLANCISDEETVYMYCNKEDYNDCKKYINNQKINIIQLELDDSWMRDIAPIFIKGDNELKCINFNFNGYGKYPNYFNDNKVGEYISNQFSITSYLNDLTLEGGAITYDEYGNLFTTESVLLNPNRNNPEKAKIEQTLTSLFDLNSIIWIPEGLKDDDTDGHIDNILCPIGNRKYLIAKSYDLDDLNSNNLTKIKSIILSNFSGIDSNIELIYIPLPSKIVVNDKKLVASYINFYFSKHKIFVPKFNVKEDEMVYDIFKDIFKDKKIEMIETSHINYGGGNIHCVTMNVPKNDS